MSVAQRPELRVLVAGTACDVDRCAQELEDAGFRPVVEIAATTTDFTRKIGEHFHIAVIGEGSGISPEEAITATRDLPMYLPVIVLTERLDDEFVARWLDIGAFDVISTDRLFRLGLAARHAFRELQRALEGMRVIGRFQKLLESAPDAILELDQQGRIVLSNAETERLFGYSRKDLIGMPIEQLIPAGLRRIHDHYAGNIASQPGWHQMGTVLELCAVGKDGTQFSVDVNLSPVHQGDNKHVMCIIRDVTERKRNEAKIRSLNEELAAANMELEARNREVERANRLKSEFLASMSHELRTPLHSIIGFSELLHEQIANTLTGKQLRFLEHIQKGARHLLDLINDILDLSKIEAGRLELHHENFEMAIAASEVLASIRPLAATKKIELDSSIPPDIALNADRVRFKEVLYNLLSNAIKFTPEGGQVCLNSRLENDYVITTVSDTGVGIAAESHESIFEAFRQIGPTTKGVREGTGLGLAITRRLIEQHGGKIWLESSPGRGACFYFSLPLTQGKDTMPPSQYAVAPSDRERPLVLIVEDDKGAAELLATYVEAEGYSVLAANTAPEALRLANEHKPDLITLDLLMPGQSGFELMNELKRSPSTAHIPIVIVSVVDERTMGLALGATEYLVKPVAKDILIETLRRYVPSTHPGQVLVVDDEQGSLQIVSHALNSSGYATVLAQTGQQAMHILEESPVSAVVLDLMMPGMNGFEVIRRIRERNEFASLPILVLTAKELTHDERDLLGGKIQACLDKRESWKAQLIENLRAALDRGDVSTANA